MGWAARGFISLITPERSKKNWFWKKKKKTQPWTQKSSQAPQTVPGDKAELGTQKCTFREENFCYSSLYLTIATSCEFLQQPSGNSIKDKNTALEMKVEQSNESLRSGCQQERWGFNFIWDVAYLGVRHKFKLFASIKCAGLVQEEAKLRCSSKPADLLAVSERTFYRDSRLLSTSKFPASWLTEKWDCWGLIHGEGNIQMLSRPGWMGHWATGSSGRYPSHGRGV